MTPGRGIYEGQTQVGRIVGISKDGKNAYMPAFWEEGEFSLLSVYLERDRKPSRHKRGTGDTWDFFVDADGEAIARERYSNNANLHRLQAYIEDDWKTIYEQRTDIITIGFEGLTPDRQSLVIKKQHPDTGRWAYYTMALATGDISEPIFAHPEKDVEYLITDIGRVVHGVRYSGFTPICTPQTSQAI